MRPFAILIATAALALATLRCQRHLPPESPIVVIVVDTLRADHLGAYGHARATSPQLDSRMTRAAVFENAYAPSPWTLPSFASIFTGLYPARHGAGVKRQGESGLRAFSSLDPSFATLSQALSQSGRRTRAMVTNVFLGPGFGLGLGFDEYDFGSNRYVSSTRRADRMVDDALVWIDEQPDPFYLVLHFFDPHIPYEPPDEARGKFTAGYSGPLTNLEINGKTMTRIRSGNLGLDDADRTFLSSSYDEELFYLDIQLGRFFEGLESRGILRQGLVVLTSDHGEELFNHGSFEHGHSMYQEVIRVPLAFWGTGVRPGRHPEPVSLVDLMPTILDAARLPVPENLDGMSLWSALTRGRKLPRRDLLVQAPMYSPAPVALVRWPYKLVFETRKKKRVFLFDLSSDPEERNNLVEEFPELTKELVSRLVNGLGSPSEAPSKEEVQLDEESREALRSLGYLD